MAGDNERRRTRVLKLWDVDKQHVVFTTGGPKGMLVNFALSPSGTLWLTRAPDAHSALLWEFRPPSSDAGPALIRREASRTRDRRRSHPTSACLPSQTG